MKGLSIRSITQKVLRSFQSEEQFSEQESFLLGLPTGDRRKANTPHTAMCLSAVFNAVDQISNDIAKLPKGVFEKKEDTRIKKTDHPTHTLISKRPHPLMSSFNFHKSMVLSALLYGNGIAIIKRNLNTGYPINLHFIPISEVKDIKRIEDELYYTIHGYAMPFRSEDIFHIPGFSLNGITGVSVFRYAANNLGTALEAEDFASDNFKSKGLLAGLIKTSHKEITPENKIKLANAMEARLSKRGTHNIGVLDEDMDFVPISTNAQETSLIDWKKVSVTDIARWFNIAPHKIKDLEKATFSNIEQQSIEHGYDTIYPWIKKIEEEYNYKLFTPKERETHYVKFNTNALIRTDIKTKSEYYSKAINFGFKTRNEVRALEDDNPIEGLDMPLTPANMVGLSQFNTQSDDT